MSRTAVGLDPRPSSARGGRHHSGGACRRRRDGELDLTEEDGGALYDAMVDCGVDLREQVIDDIVADSDLSEEDRTCLEEQFDDEFLRRLFVVVLAQGEDALQGNEALMSEVSAPSVSARAPCPKAEPPGPRRSQPKARNWPTRLAAT